MNFSFEQLIHAGGCGFIPIFQVAKKLNHTQSKCNVKTILLAIVYAGKIQHCSRGLI
jgi:NAD(P)H-flavin reductase